MTTVHRSCPACSQKLQLVRTNGQDLYCCADCSIGWRPGSSSEFSANATADSDMSFLCPDCGNRKLTRMGSTVRGEEWRCLGCHGRLVQVARPVVKSPSAAKRIGDSSTIKALGVIVEILLGLV
jgi:ribosomal protein L37AE/L43A